ncbi:MAG: hypothetical protein VX583_03820, partial [Bdellovibrionota bacterium]
LLDKICLNTVCRLDHLKKSIGDLSLEGKNLLVVEELLDGMGISGEICQSLVENDISLNLKKFIRLKKPRNLSVGDENHIRTQFGFSKNSILEQIQSFVL